MGGSVVGVLMVVFCYCIYRGNIINRNVILIKECILIEFCEINIKVIFRNNDEKERNDIRSI